MPCGENIKGRYFFNDNAPLFENPTYLQSRNWRDNDGSPLPPYGELQGKQKWRNGRFPAQKPDAILIGTEAMLVGDEACPDVDTPTVFGLPVLCWKDAPPTLVQNPITQSFGPGSAQGVDVPIIIETVDGTPSYPGVTRLKVQELDGFVLSQPAANQAMLQIAIASPSQRGVVDNAPQSFAGKKTFTSSIIVGSVGSGNQIELDRGSGVTGLTLSSYLSGSINHNIIKAESFSVVAGYVNFAIGYAPDLATGAGILAELSGDYAPTAMSYFAVSDGLGNIYSGLTGTTGGLVISGGLVTGGALAVTWGTITGKPTTLAGYAISDAQPLDGDLTSLAGATGTNTLYYRSAANTWSAVTIGSGLSFVAGTLSNTVSGIADGTYGQIVVSAGGTVWTVAAVAITALASISGLSAATPALDDELLFADVSVGGTNKKTTPTAIGQLLIPAGSVLQWAGPTVPTGYMNCDGAAVSRTTYADLFAALGVTWGAGNGTTTFNLPDLRGRALLGVGTGTGLTTRNLGSTGGTETHTLNSTQIPAHNHGASVGGVAGAFSILHGSGSGVAYGLAGGSGPYTGTGVNAVTNDNTGGGSAHNIMQPFANVYHIIKY